MSLTLSKSFLSTLWRYERSQISLLDENILHRDVSKNSIIVTVAENEGDPRGMLINLDLVK
jgi:Fungal protein kinase